jgi:hypothetical protein
MATKFRPVVRKRLQPSTTPPKTMREATGLNGATVTGSEPVTMPDLKVVHDTIVRLKRNSLEAWNHYRDVVTPKYHEGSELAKRLAKTDNRKGSLYNSAFSEWLHKNKLHHEQPTGIGEKARGALLTIVECGIDVFDAWLTELEKRMPEERAALTYPPRILRVSKCDTRGIKALIGTDLWPDDHSTDDKEVKPVGNGYDQTYNDGDDDDDAERHDEDADDAEPINTPPKADSKADEETQAEVERRLRKIADTIIDDVQPKAWRFPGPVSPGIVQRWRQAAQAVEQFTNHLAKHR